MSTTQYHPLLMGCNDCVTSLGPGSFELQRAHNLGKFHHARGTYVGIQKTVVQDNQVLAIEFFTRAQVEHHLQQKS